MNVSFSSILSFTSISTNCSLPGLFVSYLILSSVIMQFHLKVCLYKVENHELIENPPSYHLFILTPDPLCFQDGL
jgi:hypothetical protein